MIKYFRIIKIRKAKASSQKKWQKTWVSTDKVVKDDQLIMQYPLRLLVWLQDFTGHFRPVNEKQLAAYPKKIKKI